MFKSTKPALGTLTLITAAALALSGPALAGKGQGGGGSGGGGGGGGGETALFSVTELPTIGDALDPADISDPNASGEVFIVGTCFGPGEQFVWDADAAGNLVSTTTLPFNPRGVNGDRVVVGRWVGVLEAGGPTVSIAAAWQEGNFYSGLPLVAGGTDNEVWDINNNWEMVGREYGIDPDTGEQTITGVYWLLNPDGTPAEAFAFEDFAPTRISDSGYVSGRTTGVPNYPAIADLSVDPPVVTILDPLPNAVDGFCNDVNNFGEATGHQTVVHQRGEPYFHGFFSDAGGTVDLGSLRKSSWVRAWATNDVGLVVGEAADLNKRSAYLWDGSDMIRLEDVIPASSNVEVLWSAWEINSANQIICRGWNTGGGPWRAYLLTPLP